MLRSSGRMLALLLAATGLSLAGASLAKPGKPLPQPRPALWATTYEETAGGHRVGNPEAKTAVIEFMSYTCPHCADFARTGDGAIKLLYIPTGKFNYEIRHLVRDPIDLTATLLTQCGPAKKFFANHAAIMGKQDAWLETARNTSQAQRSRWQFGTNAARFRAIASDLGFYAIMEGRGYERVAIDQCLADEAKAAAIAEQSRADIVKYALQGTPSFVVDGVLLDGVHGWPALQPELDKRL